MFVKSVWTEMFLVQLKKHLSSETLEADQDQRE